MRDKFYIKRGGKSFVLFSGLLDTAHKRGLKSIDTELIQVPTEENGKMAIVKAAIELEDGRRFSGIGDADPTNVNSQIEPHLLRMAETRAKARALRDAINVGVTAVEELSNSENQEQSTPKSGNVHNINRSDPKEATKKVRKPTVDLLKTLAVEWRGENGVQRLESHIGKPLKDLTRGEAEEWVQKLTQKENSG